MRQLTTSSSIPAKDPKTQESLFRMMHMLRTLLKEQHISNPKLFHFCKNKYLQIYVNGINIVIPNSKNFNIPKMKWSKIDRSKSKKQRQVLFIKLASFLKKDLQFVCHQSKPNTVLPVDGTFCSRRRQSDF